MRTEHSAESNTTSSFHRLDQRKQLVLRVIDGLLGLREAARQFRRLQPALSCASACEPHTVEGTCRMLIGWVRLALADQPERAERVADQLEEQLPQDNHGLDALARAV